MRAWLFNACIAFMGVVGLGSVAILATDWIKARLKGKKGGGK